MESFQKEIKDFKTDLKNKTVLVTGASRGIGKAIALAFAREKCNLVIAARSKERLEQTAHDIKTIGANAHFEIIDVSQEASILAGLTQIRQSCGKIDVLINNAGIYKTSSVADHSSELWNEILSTNLTSSFIFSRELIKDMVASGWGRVINISSISGKHAEIHGAAYSASKFGMIGLTQSLALELADKGVTVNAICPGWVNTELAHEQIADPEWCRLNSIDPKDSEDIARLSVPQMRFIESDEVAQLAVYLATDMARGITGQAINICGGMCLS